MAKIIEFPTKEKRIEKVLREHLPYELPPDALEEIAAELRQVAERIENQRKSFNLIFPEAFSQGEMEFITRQVEEMIGELMSIIRGEEGEIFSLIIRYHLLLHETRRILDTE
jgi:superfamily II helicase